MAKFIEGSYGVFRPSWVQNARADYDYFNGRDSLPLRKKLGVVDTANMLIAIGVDWNKNAGTEFYVVGYSASKGCWYGLDAVNIASSQHSGQRWMQELIRLNFKWKPERLNTIDFLVKIKKTMKQSKVVDEIFPIVHTNAEGVKEITEYVLII